jgi:predicted Fe-S protein YdhL (DUF1289 family)
MAIASPCVKICVFDEEAGLCMGCGRTLAEIAGWLRLSDDERRAVMAALPERLAARRAPEPAR